MKLLLIFTSLFALGNMEQPLHVYTSEEIRLDELAKLDELGNTGNDKKGAVDPSPKPKEENTEDKKKETVDPKEENTGYDKRGALKDPNNEGQIDPNLVARNEGESRIDWIIRLFLDIGFEGQAYKDITNYVIKTVKEDS